ncbi:MAG: glycoside hydrolase family 11 protein [Eubacterium sp.]|jgi:endo-1,4-beta-xylanase|nr:glycoside hydrolase family 11 protein [Eubacterium sp.]MCR5629430.1 glycoside hydrolase family 11 protein [Eubacterium sp.]
MQRKKIAGLIAGVLCAVVALVPPLTATKAESRGQTVYDSKTGKIDGVDFSLWKDYGNTSMKLNGGGAFECQWSNIGNALFRTGKTLDSSKRYNQYGNISVNYSANYQPNGNSYLCVYGWSRNPLVEYYIVDSWGSWRPTSGQYKGQISVDGGTYDLYQDTRYNAPSIDGNTTFTQFWSVRTSKRTSGTISVSKHFDAWAQHGMTLGNLTEVALTVEGYQSSGYANVTNAVVTFGGNSNNNNNNYNNNNQNNNNNNNNNSGSWQGTTVQCESMKTSGRYTGKISNPFNGVALYANQDAVSYTQNFGYDRHNFALRACSNTNKLARVDLYIGGDFMGTFYYGDGYPATYTLKNVRHKTGNQEVKLVVTADDGSWDAYLDSFTITNP